MWASSISACPTAPAWTSSAPGARAAAQNRLFDAVDPDVWVIALGTNDIAKYASSEEYGEVVQQLLDLLPNIIIVDAIGYVERLIPLVPSAGILIEF